MTISKRPTVSKPRADQKRVSKLLTTIGIERLAAALKYRPASVALWIKAGRIPDAAFREVVSRFATEVDAVRYRNRPTEPVSSGWHRLPGAEFYLESSETARKAKGPTTPEQRAVSRLVDSIGVERLSRQLNTGTRSIALWIKRGRVGDQAMGTIRLDYAEQLAASRYKHTTSPTREGWRDLPGAEFVVTPTRTRPPTRYTRNGKMITGVRA